MQKIGILGDLHSNLSALEAVLALLELEGVTDLYCVGDLVGYGARPNEVINLVRQNNVRSVAGNHDWALLDKIDSSYFNPYARAALDWTKKTITKENSDFLESLPLIIEEDSFALFHGALPEPELFHYLRSFPAARASLGEFSQAVGFCGHTHVPMNFVLPKSGDELDWHFSQDWILGEGEKAVVNVGSPGQPRDENPLAPVVIYNPNSRRIQLLRTPYNIAAEQRLIRKAGLPGILGDRLKSGI